MPSGHSEKQTLTPYRAELLQSLPLHRRTLRNPKRFQLGNCISFGWVVEDEDGICTLSDSGRAALAGAGYK